ncbi:MAG: helix-turn-helix transcriptional regulator [Candidatus Latescibacteria bacterium]|nr:helix-turn-helix transcriptional regulator [Candidatus Latescibacterota bacterium]
MKPVSPIRVSPAIALKGLTVRIARYVPGWSQAAHEHEFASVGFVYRGSLAERVAGMEETGGPLSMIVKPPGVRHSDQYGPDGAWILQILLSREWLEAGDSDWRLGSWRWIRYGDGVRHGLALLAALRGDADRSEVESLVLEVLAGIPPASDGEPARIAPRWLRAARDRLAEEFADGVSVSGIARDAGVHPVSLARAFRRTYGTSITALRHRLCVSLAAAQLGGNLTPLSSVAQLSGFSDQAHMCRIFKKTTGLTPLSYRKLTES